MSVLNVDLSDDIFKRLESLAKKTRKTKDFFIKQLIEENLEDYEYAYEAESRLNDNNAKFLTTEEVELGLGL